MSDDTQIDESAASGSRLSTRVWAWTLLVGGLIGFYASFELTIERIRTLEDPSYVPSCDLSAWATCGPAMGSWQGSLLGFPNPLVGIAAFAVVVTTAVVVLTGATVPRWYRLALLVGATVGLGFVVFAIWTSLYVLGALCPWCMVVWAVTIPIFWLHLVYCVQERDLSVGEGLRRALVQNRWVGLALLYVAVLLWVMITMGDVIVASF
ncbi:Uncharacterized membrane protein [Paraoerskovia marina]|uniref:Uncharacterized membrane protein n=1 Tax=Paraoerskovia marina TaxID=545619 RepID=A0A1H1RS88_9CELL|nr:vitamin K epoxide reductase family protein [Paraoerskovia marina]SDS38605.1 Uncharacterized membrane protein [Paraoerskovia marina]